MFQVIVLNSLNPDISMEEIHVDCVLIDTLVLSDLFEAVLLSRVRLYPQATFSVVTITMQTVFSCDFTDIIVSRLSC